MMLTVVALVSFYFGVLLMALLHVAAEETR